MDHRELSRLMRAKTQLTMYWLERIAAAGRVSPAFFREYRTMFVTERMVAVFDAHPNLSIGVMRRFVQLEK